ncbi:MAG: DUF58 domain-containing protein, partial [Armatimonadota bacterium]
ALFIMAAAVIATIFAARLQAYLAVRALRFERFVPPAVKVGEPTTVEIIVWSERRIKRPLVTITDAIPKRLIGEQLVNSLPVAPSYDQPIKTRYIFKPIRRGRYHWERLTAEASDATGLVSQNKQYHADPVDLTVYPSPLAVNVDLSPIVGWGASELDEGKHRGSGMEPHGIREYAYGDPMRYVHWRSTARRGKLMVKEFETGSGVSVNFFLQRTQGTEVSGKETSTFEAMCANALYLASDFIKKGATVCFPTEEARAVQRAHAEVREREVREVLTDIQPNVSQLLSQDVSQYRPNIRAGETIAIFVAVQDSLLPAAIAGWTDVQVTILAYNPAEYGEVPTQLAKATDPQYISALEMAGAKVIVIPRMEHLA